MNSVLRLRNVKRNTTTFGTGLFVGISNTNVVTMRTRLRLFGTINFYLNRNRLRRGTTRAATPNFFRRESPRSYAVTVLSIQPRLYRTGLSRRLFSNGDASLGVRHTNFETYRPLLRHFRAHTFFQMTNRGIYFTMNYGTRYIRHFNVIYTRATCHRRFSIKRLRNALSSLRNRRFFLFKVNLSWRLQSNFAAPRHGGKTTTPYSERYNSRFST